MKAERRELNFEHFAPNWCYFYERVNSMKRMFFVYVGVTIITLQRGMRYGFRVAGELFKVLGRKMVAWGEDHEPRWGVQVLLDMYHVDAEIHIGMKIYRGPLYAMFPRLFGGTRLKALILKMNWVAEKPALGGDWEYSGSCDFRLSQYGPPLFLDTGDLYFSCSDGTYVTIHKRVDWKEESQFKFAGDPDTPRVYQYF